MSRFEGTWKGISDEKNSKNRRANVGKYKTKDNKENNFLPEER